MVPSFQIKTMSDRIVKTKMQREIRGFSYTYYMQYQSIIQISNGKLEELLAILL